MVREGDVLVAFDGKLMDRVKVVCLCACACLYRAC